MSSQRQDTRPRLSTVLCPTAIASDVPCQIALRMSDPLLHPRRVPEKLQGLCRLQCALHMLPSLPCAHVLACTLQVRAQLQGVHRLPVWAAPEPPNAMHLPAFSAYPQLYVTAAGEHLMMLPQLLESLQAGPEVDQAEGDSEWLDRVSVADSSMSCGSSHMVKQPCGCHQDIGRLGMLAGGTAGGSRALPVQPVVAKHLQEDGRLVPLHHASLPGTVKHSVGAIVGVDYSTAAPLARAPLRRCSPRCALPTCQTHTH